jgi:ArsR family transcriptional regulator, arsenate/arsenite/antimonite-responsive transcriptional repressor
VKVEQTPGLDAGDVYRQARDHQAAVYASSYDTERGLGRLAAWMRQESASDPDATGHTASDTMEFPCPPLGAAELSAADAERMASMFKALADPIRLRLFSRIAAQQSGEASVCDIQNVGVSQPTVTHHLKKLREAGLIISERRGTWVYCRVAPGVLPAMAQMLAPRTDAQDRDANPGNELAGTPARMTPNAVSSA